MTQTHVQEPGGAPFSATEATASVQVEICVDTVPGALAAQRGGAHRVELCANLAEGGTTPSAGCLEMARRFLQIPIFVMIRPRGGDFLYSPEELQAMRRDIMFAKALGADGVVFGCLTAEGDFDLDRMQELVELARPMKVTIHRAFDMCRDADSALAQLMELGADRVLTSGQEASCLAGAPAIRRWRQLATDRTIILPGGGITPLNARRLVAETGATEIHLSARGKVESRMTYRNPRCAMGAASSEFAWATTDERTVRAVVEAVAAPA